MLAAAPLFYRPLVLSLVGPGLRISQVCGLRVEDVDFLRRTVCIRQQRRPGGELGTLKTGSSRRDVPADDIVLQALAEEIRQHPRADGLVFGSSTGGALTRSVAGHVFDDIERAVGLTVSPTPCATASVRAWSHAGSRSSPSAAGWDTRDRRSPTACTPT